jgi:hypothetical protein
MSSCATKACAVHSPTDKHLNPAELKIDLLCSGIRIDGSCRIKQDGPSLPEVPSDPASGLEMILPGEMRDIWVNAPIRGSFVSETPYRLTLNDDNYLLLDERRDLAYGIRIPRRPDWYDLPAPSGGPLSRIGTLQGTFLSIGLEDRCFIENDGQGLHRRFWSSGAPETTSLKEKTVEDVIEAASIARQRSGVTFVLLRGGCHGNGGLSRAFPYLSALKKHVGILVGLQFPPEADLRTYDEARALGVDHISFCKEFFNQDYCNLFHTDLSAAPDRESLIKALEHCARVLGKGRVFGKIVAGVEPIEDTLHAIDYFAEIGALPLVSIFRPMPGMDKKEDCAAPRYEEMLRVFRRVYEVCRGHNLPIGMAPNIHVSGLLHPEDTLYLAPDSAEGEAYLCWIHTMKQVMRPYFLRRMRKHKPPQR